MEMVSPSRRALARHFPSLPAIPDTQRRELGPRKVTQLQRSWAQSPHPSPVPAASRAGVWGSPNTGSVPVLPADQTYASPPDLGHGRKHPGSCLRERDEKSSQKDAPGDLPVLPGTCPQQPRVAGMPQTPGQARGVLGVRGASVGWVCSQEPGTQALHTSAVWPRLFSARQEQISCGPQRYEQSPTGHSTGSQGQGSGLPPLWFPSAFLSLCRTSPSPWTSSTPGTPQPSPTPPTHCQPPPTPRTPCTSMAASTTVTAVTGPWAATCSPLPPSKQEITVMVSEEDPGSLAP